MAGKRGRRSGRSKRNNGILRNPKRSTNRRRNRLRVQGGERVVVRAEGTFTTAPGRAGATYFESLNAWWIIGLELAQVIIGWILCRASASAYNAKFWSLKPRTAKLNEATKLTDKTATLMIPVCASSRSLISVDPLICQSAFIFDTISAKPENAPYPFDSSIPAYTAYGLTRFEKYRILWINIKFTSEVQRSEQVGRYHIGFSTCPVDYRFDQYRRSDDRFPAIPTVESIKQSQYYREILMGGTATIRYTPSGYWRDWHQLGVGIEADAGQFATVINNTPWDWNRGGLGSMPFGELTIAHEVVAEDTPDKLVLAYDPERTSLRISYSAGLILQGHARNTQHTITGATISTGTSSVRVIRAYHPCSMNQDYLQKLAFASDRTPYIPKTTTVRIRSLSDYDME